MSDLLHTLRLDVLASYKQNWQEKGRRTYSRAVRTRLLSTNTPRPLFAVSVTTMDHHQNLLFFTVSHVTRR